ncbi:MAG: FAD-dependent oxidoreductase [Deltaproteobacteria bacterium]|nr:FAD-dependent oxidoreductase [Deltaproteobacteria bacterium]
MIGAGVGGLAAAIALRRKGHDVTILEATDRIGGLAGGFDVDGKSHDGGPYILLDRPGLAWAFERLGLVLDEHVDLIALDEIYRVRRPGGPDIHIYADLARTADALPDGARDAYIAFVRRMIEIHEHLAPLQRAPFRGARALVRRGLVREAVFLLRGLDGNLRSTKLPDAVRDALGIWTHIAGQPLEEAPAPLALVPALIHTHGAYTVRGGIRRIPEALARVAEPLGIDVRFRTPVTRIVRDRRRVLGVETAEGERIDASLVISNAPGIATYTRLLDPPDPALSAELAQLPLQSPGIAAYIEADVGRDVPFLQFWLPGNGEKCRVLIHAGAVDDSRRGTVRIVSPMDHGGDADTQRAHLARVLDEPWWRPGITNPRVVATRIPVEWGTRHYLWRDSMNPTMTASFMRKGRIAHQSPVADNLRLCGAATHPGQWVSFCAISGVLAADAT